MVIIRRIGWFLGLSWVAVTIGLQFVPFKTAEPYTLGGEGGWLPLQLASYSFLHFAWDHLISDLIMLAGLVRLAGDYLRPEGFVRVYTLGAVGGGALRVWMASLLGRGPLESLGVGPWLALDTLFVVLAALDPTRRVFFLGEKAAETIRGGGWLLLGVLGVFYYSILAAAWLWMLLLFVSNWGVVFLSMSRVRVVWLAAAVVLSSLGLYVWSSRPGAVLSYAILIVAAVVYGLAERLWAKHTVR